MATYHRKFIPKSTTDLVRLGSKYDGGYVLPSRVFLASKGLISFGLCDDWSFEASFVEQAECDVVVFDPSVNYRFLARRSLSEIFKTFFLMKPNNISKLFSIFGYFRFFQVVGRKHVKKSVGYPGESSVSLIQAFDIANFDDPVFLKIDVEGWEYRLLDDLASTCHRITGLAIEFHDVDLHEDRIVNFIDRVSEHLDLVHFHPNTYTQIGPDGFALAVEMTFLSKSLISDEIKNNDKLPIAGLDSPNTVGGVHAEIHFR